MESLTPFSTFNAFFGVTEAVCPLCVEYPRSMVQPHLLAACLGHASGQIRAEGKAVVHHLFDLFVDQLFLFYGRLIVWIFWQQTAPLSDS